MINTKYATLIVDDDTGFDTLKFAPLLPDGSTDEDYLEDGWKKIILTPQPDVDTSRFIVKQDGYEETETQLILKWKTLEKTELPKIVSKYKLIKKLMEMNLWTQVKQILEENNLLDLFNAAQELNSEDYFFKQGIQLAKQELSVTDEQIQQIIEQIIAD